MARIQLSAPQHVLEKVTIPVRITDINYGNHVGNDAFVSIIHEARMQWLHKHEYTETNIEGAGLIMTGLAVTFKNEGFYGDVIEVKISTGEISRVGFELYYTLTTQRNNTAIVLAVAKTDMVCYDYNQKKVIAVSDTINTLLTTKS
jgi:acyl-CoA thioester hydrolase